MSLQAAYAASIPEDFPVNSVLLRVGATDADMGISAWIQYSLHGPGSQDFRIDPDTGMNITWLSKQTAIVHFYVIQNLHKVEPVSYPVLLNFV